EKTAAKLLGEYKTLDAILENAADIKPPKTGEKLVAGKESALLSRTLATIERGLSLPIDREALSLKNILNPEVYEEFKQLEFKSLLARFNVSARQDVSEIPELCIIKNIDEAKKHLDSITEGIISCCILHENSRICGIALSSENSTVYIDCGETLDYAIPVSSLADSLKGFFERDNIKLIAPDFKNFHSLLRPLGVSPKLCEFDLGLAGYILNATKDAYDYDDLSSEFLNEALLSEEELLGKGKSKKSFSSLSAEKRADFAAANAAAGLKLFPELSRRIEENSQHELYYEIELPLTEVLAEMEHLGIAVDKEELLRFKSSLEEDIAHTEQEIYELAGEKFNINSPKQLGVILFEKMGLKGGKKTKTGYSTAADVLENLRGESALVERILHYRQLSKLYSTYAVGLLNVCDPKTHRIYSTFKQTVTATGRLSSTEPNLQNIPIRLELGRQLRKAFVPAKGCVFLDADYSQIELRVLAAMSGDETLINAFISGQDIHRLTASQVFATDYDEVTSEMRGHAKAVNFGIIYGIGAFSLSRDIGVTRKEAERYIQGYFKKYPRIKGFLDNIIRSAEERGFAETIFHRRRAMPELLSGNHAVKSFGERAAMNMPIQGTAADIIKIAMLKIYRALKEENLKSRLILQVHDELLIEAPEEEAEKVAALLKENMEHAVDFACPLEAEIKQGKSWYSAK
ncbi:MAG: DNA polymerase I, partial [Firmicutes bacterium]|nr:DNA polymerase I [Bacillota bacterium]